MKVILLILIVPLLMCWSGSAKAQQTGLQGINYQAIARDSKGAAMALQPLQVRLSILDGSETGNPVYIELHKPTTTAQGLFTLVIGQGVAQFGSFSSVPWSKGNQFLQVDIDVTGAGNFTAIGVMPFMSVPYALYAANGGSGGGSNGSNAVSITWLGTYTAPPAAPAQNQAYYNSTDRKSYIYDSTGNWTIITEDGNPGVSVYWLGAFATEPVGATLNQAYYSTTDKKAYIYDGTAWQILTQDGVPGVSLNWLGASATAPASPTLNQGYYNTTDRASYIYDGTTWQLLAEGGSGFVIKKIYYTPTGKTVLTTSLGDSVVTEGRSWLVSGNNGTDGGNADFIGTLDAKPFVIKTNGNGTSNERIRFTSGPGIIINGTTDTASVNGFGMLTVFSGNTDQGINADPTLLNGINAYAAGGNSAAVQGRNSSTGFGIKGVSSAGIGVYGYSSNRASVPIRGETSSLNGGFGVVGATGSPGVFNNTTNYGSGVLGLGGNADGIGVLGVGNNIDSRSSMPLATGLASYPMGAGLAGIGSPFGTYSVGMSTVGVGVLAGGTSTKPIVPANGAGVSGSSYNVGVAGFAVASTAANPELSRWGGYFEYKTSNLYASATLVYSYLAGRTFDGTSNIYVGIASSGVKSTIVKDDEGKRRLLFCTESPEVLFQDFGAGQLKNGTTHIDLERLLTRSIRVDEKHPLKVFIQLEGECNGVFVTNKSAKGFDVKELQGGKSDVPFTWQIVASRADETDATGATVGYSDARFTLAPDPMKVIMPDTVAAATTPAKAVLKTEEAAIVNKAFSNLQFSTGKAEITRSSFSSLDTMATLLQAHPEWTLKLSGHTDNEGTATFNQTLSEKRSEAVKQYLETKGVDAKRVSTIGYGQTKPLTTNQTKAEREKNRRVEMEIFTEQQ